jgi:hypothetical protein
MPKKETVRVTIDLPEALWKAARTKAMEERRPLSRIILKMVEKWVARKGGHA